MIGMSADGSFAERFSRMISAVPLTERQRKIILEEYIPATEAIIGEHYWTLRKYYALMVTGIVSSISVTALISLQKLKSLTPGDEQAVFWVSLATSIVATISMKLMYSTGIYKQYVVGGIASTRMQAEGWNYVASAGKYKDISSHERFQVFVTSFLEIITTSDGEKITSAEGGSAIPEQLGGARAPPVSSDEEVTVTITEEAQIATTEKPPKKYDL